MCSYLPLLFFIILFETITSQGPELPAQCRGPPPPVANPQECCPLPPFFKDEEFERCGFVKLDGSSAPPRPGPPDCTKQLCILKNQNLLKDEENIDPDAFNAFLDRWVTENPQFEPAIGQTKERCVGQELPGPPGICEANKLLFCLSSTLFTECPVWTESNDCSKLKSHIDECKAYFNP